MASDLSILSVPLPALAETPTSANTPNTQPVGSALGAMAPQSATFELAPGLGILVIQFRNEAGQLVDSIPTAAQLAAYRHGTAAAPPVAGGRASNSAGAESPAAAASSSSRGGKRG